MVTKSLNQHDKYFYRDMFYVFRSFLRLKTLFIGLFWFYAVLNNASLAHWRTALR